MQAYILYKKMVSHLHVFICDNVSENYVNMQKMISHLCVFTCDNITKNYKKMFIYRIHRKMLSPVCK